MSFGRDRIGHEAGELFERYVQDIFRFAGFKTERDKMFFQSVKHEIDVWAECEFGTVMVECKDWRFISQNDIKSICDKFIGKVHQLRPTTGIVVVSIPDSGEYTRYRQYLKANGLYFWDAKDVEKWKQDVERYGQPQYRQRLFDELGIKTHEPTGKEKSMKALKTLGRFALKSAEVGANVSMKILDNISDDGAYAKQRRKGRRKRRQ